MKILFCNVGWMSFYNGVRDGDEPVRGGAYNKDNIGHEACNFTNSGGLVYGYVQPTGEINIERLGAVHTDDSIDGVTVVWLAGPQGGGTVVVGWYHNATVYRNVQTHVPPTQAHRDSGINSFRVKARFEDAVLLSEDSRNVLIPRGVKGGIGQSNVWYADKAESKPHIDRVINLIEQGYSFPELEEEVSGVEGTVRFRAHLARERNRAIIAKKKKQALEKGALSCEICDFDFGAFYGSLGRDYCEVHHLTPLSKADGLVKTTLSDLAIVCSNCHRMIHRSEPMKNIQQMKDLLASAAVSDSELQLEV